MVSGIPSADCSMVKPSGIWRSILTEGVYKRDAMSIIRIAGGSGPGLDIAAENPRAAENVHKVSNKDSADGNNSYCLISEIRGRLMPIMFLRTVKGR